VVSTQVAHPIYRPPDSIQPLERFEVRSIGDWSMSHTATVAITTRSLAAMRDRGICGQCATSDQVANGAHFESFERLKWNQAVCNGLCNLRSIHFRPDSLASSSPLV